MCNNLADELILLENRTRENFTLMYFLGMWVFSIYCEINTLYKKKTDLGGSNAFFYMIFRICKVFFISFKRY